LARSSADSVCLCAHRYLHHALSRPHTRPRTHNIPLQPHFTPTSSRPTLFYLIAISVLAIIACPGRTPGLVVPTIAKDSATLTDRDIHSTHSINSHTHLTPTRLGKVYTRDLVVTPSSPNQREFVCGVCIGTAQVGISLVSLFDPLFKRSRLHCFDVCLT